MIIKIIPEKNESIKEVEHHNVKEFFIFGNKSDEDNTLVDFHDWSGQYRYLEGSLYYFLKVIECERASKGVSAKKEIDLPMPPQAPHEPMMKNIPLDHPHLQILNPEEPSEGAEDEVDAGENTVEVNAEDLIVKDE